MYTSNLVLPRKKSLIALLADTIQKRCVRPLLDNNFQMISAINSFLKCDVDQARDVASK